MRPRRQSMDSETSSDSWSVIQKNSQPEISSAEIDFEPSDSEHWDSDSAQDPHEYDSSDDDGSDSLEECDEPDGVDDESGDCEIVDENEAMEETSCRYFVSSEKVYQLLDMLNAECCTSIGETLKCTWMSSRDSTRAAVLLIFIVTTGIFFTSNFRVGKTPTGIDNSDEIFAPGLQSREDLGRVYMPVLPRRASYNFSEVCQPWQKSTWSMPPGSSAPIEPPTGLPLYVSRNATPTFEINDISSLFTRPVVTTVARISISRPAKARRDVCSQPEVRRNSSVYSRSPKVNTLPQVKRDDESTRPARPPPRLAAAPISISRIAKVGGGVCTEKSKPRHQLPRLPYPKSISLTKKATLKLAGPRRPLITYMKPTKPCAAKRNKISALVPAAPRSLAVQRKRQAVAHRSLRPRPWAERNITRKPCKGSKALLSSLPTRQLSPYKRRGPLAPSLPPLPRRPCVQQSDGVQCWKSLQDRINPSKTSHNDWFTRRGQIRAKNRRH